MTLQNLVGIGKLKPHSATAQELARLLGSAAGRNRADPPDIAHVMQGIRELLDRSIGAEPFKLAERGPGNYGIDLSKIDFEALAKRFRNDKATNSDLERLKAAVRAQLERLVRLNQTRANYLDKFQDLIGAYNTGSRNIDEIFRDLLALSQDLTEEQGRHVREHLSEEELTVFDLLTRPGPELTSEELEEVKKVSRSLLQRLKALLVLDWRQRTSSRAQIRLAIEDTLDDGLPRVYTKDVYQTKCNALFEHIYEAYRGEGKSFYSEGP